MAKYMLTTPAFLPDGQYYEASLASPLILNLPDDVGPSLTWVPLDQEAKDALDAHRAAQVKSRIDAGEKVTMAERDVPRVKKMQGGGQSVASLPMATVKPKEKIDPDAVEAAAFNRVVQAQKPKGTPEVTVQVPKGKRPSDQEPT